MTQYAFDNAAPQAASRFDSLAALYDRRTIGRLEAIGVTDGWQCLEVGGGGAPSPRGWPAGWARRDGSS